MRGVGALQPVQGFGGVLRHIFTAQVKLTQGFSGAAVQGVDGGFAVPRQGFCGFAVLVQGAGVGVVGVLFAGFGGGLVVGEGFGGDAVAVVVAEEQHGAGVTVGGGFFQPGACFVAALFRQAELAEFARGVTAFGFGGLLVPQGGPGDVSVVFVVVAEGFHGGDVALGSGATEPF